MRKFRLLLFISLLIVNCSPSSIDRAAIQQEVSATFDAYVNHLNTTGIAGVDFYFSQNEDFYWVEDGVLQYAMYNSLKDGINAFAPTVEKVDFQLLEKKIQVIDDRNASMYVQYKQDLTLVSGFSFTLEGAITMLIVKEENNEWKFRNGHSSVIKERGN